MAARIPYPPPPSSQATTSEELWPLKFRLPVYATFGLVLNAWARSMAKLPVRAGPFSYIAWAAGTAAGGYGLYKWEEYRFAAIEIDRDMLARRRMRRLAKEAEADA
ncbi:hypothetical protein HK405_009725 [Cladochytrium tenue]|nr:hypothetical protein HK405_009725 [Cladochytrium tenue]